MQYDPIKRSLGKVFNRSAALRKLFYNLLDILLLRSWHVKKQLRGWAALQKGEVNVLDAGSGFGQYVYFLSKKHPDWSILGLDVKEEQIDDCNQFFSKIGASKVKFETADLTALTFSNRFDLVLCVDVMEHIEEDRKVLNNYFNALKKGGMLLISTPSDQGGSDVHDDHHADGAVGFIDEHVRDGYAVADLDEKLKSAGFTKTDIRYQYGWPGKISWKLSMKYPIQLLNVSKLFFVLLPFYYVLFFPFCLVLNWLDVRLTHKTGTGLIARAWK
ncbi:MAG: type 11 methyltransferase [Bacteroidetes bacterium]|nr:MAG: type 11 methyltransferase [Bacteroidota bacterium]